MRNKEILCDFYGDTRVRVRALREVFFFRRRTYLVRVARFYSESRYRKKRVKSEGEIASFMLIGRAEILKACNLRKLIVLTCM